MKKTTHQQCRVVLKPILRFLTTTSLIDKKKPALKQQELSFRGPWRCCRRVVSGPRNATRVLTLRSKFGRSRIPWTGSESSIQLSWMIAGG